MTARALPFTPAPRGGLEHQQPRVLAHRVDALYLGFQGKLREELRAELARGLAKAASLKTEVAIEFSAGGGCLRAALSTRSREGMWTLESTWLTVRIDERGTNDWILEVRPSALLLLQEGPRQALALARDVAKAVLETPTGEHLRRIDLCADVVHFDLATVDVRHLVAHARTRITDCRSMREYWQAGGRTGFVAGSGGDVMARVYDKTKHLHLRLDEKKKDAEFQTWRFAGWNGTDDVTRVEYQVRGQVLRELEIRDPEKALGRLDAIWAYCTHKWLRLVDRTTATRRERCASDRRWRALDAVVFRERSAPARRLRAPSTPHALRLVSVVLNYNAAAGFLAFHVGDARLHVANWTDARAEAWIQQHLFDNAVRTVRATAAQWMGKYGGDAKMAAAALMEKGSAAVAKHSTLCLAATDAAVAA